MVSSWVIIFFVLNNNGMDQIRKEVWYRRIIETTFSLRLYKHRDREEGSHQNRLFELFKSWKINEVLWKYFIVSSIVLRTFLVHSDRVLRSFYVSMFLLSKKRMSYLFAEVFKEEGEITKKINILYIEYIHIHFMCTCIEQICVEYPIFS